MSCFFNVLCKRHFSFCDRSRRFVCWFVCFSCLWAETQETAAPIHWRHYIHPGRAQLPFSHTFIYSREHDQKHKPIRGNMHTPSPFSRLCHGSWNPVLNQIDWCSIIDYFLYYLFIRKHPNPPRLPLRANYSVEDRYKRLLRTRATETLGKRPTHNEDHIREDHWVRKKWKVLQGPFDT